MLCKEDVLLATRTLLLGFTRRDVGVAGKLQQGGLVWRTKELEPLRFWLGTVYQSFSVVLLTPY